ncbi:DivIVA domain-containing protein [Actinosynnema sp. NPDC053489]|uniref:DivIVA domain-containing protein n=1 Tax=Actinosynnema sp. NPDC053489 TaxID=3363916 RepID=UPI0037C705F7
MHIDKSRGRSFPVRWRGYDRREVDAELVRARLEADRLREELEVLRTDRDAAVATADDLMRELEDARSELAEYRVLHAGYSKDNAVSGCIRYLMHVARQKADAFETDARERSEQMLKRAEEVARQQAVLLDETEQETQRRLAEAEQRAREIVQQATAEASALLAGQVDGRDRWTADTAPPSLDVPLPRIISGPLPVVQPDAEERPTSA